MRVNDLQNDQKVRARWGRAGREGPNWGPWRDVQLFVQRSKGRVAVVALKDISWAECSEDDLCSPSGDLQNAYFLVEDYYLEIEGLTR